MRSNSGRAIALGGVLAAVAVVIMCLGGFIPVATYACPMLCALTLFIVLRFCGKRIGWTWFAAVSMLSLLMGPDKEAAFVFLTVGYYPLIKGRMERSKLHLLWKFLFFNGAIVLAYSTMIYLFGMQEIAQENMEFGLAGLCIILALGNLTFLLLDQLLGIMARKLR